MLHFNPGSGYHVLCTAVTTAWGGQFVFDMFIFLLTLIRSQPEEHGVRNISDIFLRDGMCFEVNLSPDLPYWIIRCIVLRVSRGWVDSVISSMMCHVFRAMCAVNAANLVVLLVSHDFFPLTSTGAENFVGSSSGSLTTTCSKNGLT